MSSRAKAKDLRTFDKEKILRHFVPQNDIYGSRSGKKSRLLSGIRITPNFLKNQFMEATYGL